MHVSELGSMEDKPGMMVRPPRLYLGALVVGMALQMLQPLAWVPWSIESAAGIPLVVLALILFIAAIREMRRAHTGIRADQPSTTIVERGPYRFSRNPIYLAFTLLQLGLAVWLNNAWLLVTLLMAVIVVSFGVIAREERYLERKFGDTYLQYKRRVRRWI